MDRFDICIVGAGVIGLGIAYQLAQVAKKSSPSIVVLEQESGFGQHTSSRNSEVIHAGIYYDSDSLKAALCVRGKQLLYQHCEDFNVPYRRIGKFIVAHRRQRSQLETIRQQAAANGVEDLQWVEGGKLAAAEPALSTDCALFSPSTGIIDSHSYMQSLLHLAQNHGVEFAPRTRVQAVAKIADDFHIHTGIGEAGNLENYSFACGILINSAGLNAQSLAHRIEGLDTATLPRLHLCKGDYFNYSGKSPFKHLIYPLPEANAQGLGIHATLDMASQLRFGPDTSYVDSVDYAIDSSKASRFAAAIADYFPGISAAQLTPAYAGMRPKLAAAGESAADFVIQDGSDVGMAGLIQLFGFESPGLTANLAIGERISEMVNELGA